MRSIKATMIGTGALLGLVGCLAAPSAALSAPTPAPAPLQDSVTGTVTTLGFVDQVIRWQITATSGPSGENPTGRISAVFEGVGPFFEGPVTCLSVQDNVALVKTQDSLFGLLLAFRITDNAGLGIGDLVETTFASPGASDCPAESSYIRMDRVTSGDIAVEDAPPLPASTDQCKDGGWRAFGGTFSNQGQCVASVQRGPKPS
jgi:hypothetical protein